MGRSPLEMGPEGPPACLAGQHGPPGVILPVITTVTFFLGILFTLCCCVCIRCRPRSASVAPLPEVMAASSARREPPPTNVLRWKQLVAGALRLTRRRKLWHGLGVQLDYIKKRGRGLEEAHWLSRW